MMGARFGRVVRLGAVSLLMVYGVVLGLAGSPFFPLAAQAQTFGSVPGNTSGTQSDTDIWRAIRQGQPGYVAGPASKRRQLIVAPPPDCAKSGSCTEQVLRFSLPIHSRMPAIKEYQGPGNIGAPRIFLIALLAGLAAGGLLFIGKLGRPDGDTPAQR